MASIYAFFLILVLLGLFTAAMVVLAIVIARALSTSRAGNGARDQALQILEERYARGELSRDQYMQMRRDLTEEQIST